MECLIEQVVESKNKKERWVTCELFRKIKGIVSILFSQKVGIVSAGFEVRVSLM